MRGSDIVLPSGAPFRAELLVGAGVVATVLEHQPLRTFMFDGGQPVVHVSLSIHQVTLARSASDVYRN